MQDRDPFLESPEAVVIIGVARIFLQSLAFLVGYSEHFRVIVYFIFHTLSELQMEIQEHVPITDLRGIQIGSMEIALVPVVDAQGHQPMEPNLIASGDHLIGKNVYFDFHIIGCRNLPSKFKVRYSIIHTKEFKNKFPKLY